MNPIFIYKFNFSIINPIIVYKFIFCLRIHFLFHALTSTYEVAAVFSFSFF